MEDESHVVVTIQLKVILKELLEKLRLPTVSYECEKHGPYYQPSFLAKVNLKTNLDNANNMDSRNT